MADPTQSALVQRVQALEAKPKTKAKSTNAPGTTSGYNRITPQTAGSGTTASSWTSVSVGNHIPTNATAVYGSCRLKTPALVADTKFTIDGRRESSDTTRNLLTVYGIVGTAPDAGGGSATFILPVLNGTFQFQVTTTGANPASWDIKIEAYFA